MNLAKNLSPLNNEIRNIMLSFYLNTNEPITAENIVVDLDKILDEDSWLPTTSSIGEYLVKFKQAGLASKPRQGNYPYSEQSGYLGTDQRHSTAAKFLLRYSVESNISLFSIFGHNKKEDASTNSSVENRLSIFNSLADGSSKTLTQLCDETDLEHSQLSSALSSLNSVGMVNIPKVSILDGNTYQVNKEKNMNDYFQSRIPESIRTAVLLLKQSDAVTPADLEQAECIDSSSAYRVLHHLENKGFITQNKQESTFSYKLARKYKGGNDPGHEKLDKHILEKSLKNADRPLLDFYREIIANKGTTTFNIVDLKSYLKEFTPHTMRNAVNRLIDHGYVTLKTDCLSDKFYSLSKNGRDFVSGVLQPLDRFFESSDETVASADAFFEDASVRNDHIQKGFDIYEKVSPFKQRKEMCSRAYDVMEVLHGAGRVPKKTVIQELGLRTNGVLISLKHAFEYLQSQNYIKCDRDGSYVMCSLTKTGKEMIEKSDRCN